MCAAGGLKPVIALDPDAFGLEALAGLADFSHLEVLFYFHRVPETKIETGARHPRGRTDWPLVGIFAQRGKNRPNRLGLCTCRILSVTGLEVEVQGLDAIDGTPVLDLKPVMKEFLPREAERPMSSEPDTTHVRRLDDLVRRDAFTLAGAKGVFDQATQGDIPALWPKLIAVLPLPGQVGGVTYGAMWPVDRETGRFGYLAGVEVTGDAELPADIERMTLAAQTYA
eukprot:gene17599-17803_t